jgi:predicted Zn-dependent protease
VAEVENTALKSTVPKVEVVAKTDTLCKKHEDLSVLRECIRMLAQVRNPEAMNKVIEIQPDYLGASAYDALAQLELATRLTGGKAEKAIEYLEKALKLEKENTFIRLHLAEAYLAVNRDAEAKKQIDYLLKMKPDPDYLPEYKESTEKAKELLKTKF